MRGRIGGRIGSSFPPSYYGASGIWGIADILAAKIGAYGFDQYSGSMPWPAIAVMISWPTGGYYNPNQIDWVDATVTGSVTFSAIVSTNIVDLPFSYYWERSTDSGVTWSVVSGSSGSSTAANDSYGGGAATVTLDRTGQTVSNDDEKYRIVVVAGLKTYTGPTGTLRFDTVTFVDGNQGLSSDYDYYSSSLAVASGEEFSWRSSGSFVGVKYEQAYDASDAAMQSSIDGGATWQSESGYYLSLPSVSKSYTASPSDNGKKWRGVYTFRGQTYFTGVATLTVT